MRWWRRWGLPDGRPDRPAGLSAPAARRRRARRGAPVLLGSGGALGSLPDALFHGNGALYFDEERPPPDGPHLGAPPPAGRGLHRRVRDSRGDRDPTPSDPAGRWDSLDPVLRRGLSGQRPRGAVRSAAARPTGHSAVATPAHAASLHRPRMVGHADMSRDAVSARRRRRPKPGTRAWRLPRRRTFPDNRLVSGVIHPHHVRVP